MKTFEFSIIATGLDPSDEAYEARFYDGKCSDATVSYQRGHTIIDFAREAASLEDAISTAVEDAIAVGCKIERLEPDPLVSLADIASRAGMSRAAMSLYAKGQRGKGFPAPSIRITSENPLWAWTDVARWLFQNQKIQHDQLIEAEAVRQANELLASGNQHIGVELHSRMSARVQDYESCT